MVVVPSVKLKIEEVVLQGCHYNRAEVSRASPVFNMLYNTKNAFITCAAVSVLLLILAGPIHQVQGLPNGAPTAACGSMSPTAGHSVNPQQSSAPYVTTAVSDQVYKSDKNDFFQNQKEDGNLIDKSLLRLTLP